MHAVIFEVWPKQGCREAYLEIAASLKADLMVKVCGHSSTAA